MLRVPPLPIVEQIEDLYRQSLFLDAYACFRDLDPPEQWSETRARLIAGRTLENLGASRRAYRLHLATWKKDPASTAALYYHALGFSDRHGPVEALRMLNELRPATPETKPETPHEGYLCLLRARCLGRLRDFDAAERWLSGTEASFARDPWVFVEKAGVLEQRDRYDEALAASEHALTLRPHYRPAIGMTAHLLTLMNRDDEAVRMLKEHVATTQCIWLARQLALLLVENEAYTEALSVVETTAGRCPLAEPVWIEWLSARRADLLYLLGRDDEALVHAKKVPGAYYEHIARRLESPAPRSRKRLQVSFVRQHHVTCVPATISAVSAFLGKPVDQAEMARVITYDGTPDHEERHWLEARGWHVREFRVTWETGVALISRDIPFTLVTTWVRSAHLQAVIGCDERLGTFIIRDPTHRVHFECLAEEYLRQQAPYGPRGMILLPPEQVHRLDGIPLPDSSLYDALYRLRRALNRHDRQEAERQADALFSETPEHRLAWSARRELAWYDGSPSRAHEATLALRALYPEDVNLQLDELGELRQLGQKHAHDRRLREAALRRGADPIFWRSFAEELRADAREHGRALRYARRLVRTRPVDCHNLLAFAHLLWDGGFFADATKVYRLAAAVGETVEHAWSSFFAASRHQRDTDTALRLLRERWLRLREKSSQPVLTLCRCLEQLNRGPEALDLLREALAMRPQDGDLHLFATETFGRTGAYAEAEEHLERARGFTSPAAWHRTATDLARWRGRHTDALDHSLAVLRNNPLDAGMAAQRVHLLATTSGRGAAIAWIEEQVAQHPHFLPFRQLQVNWLREDTPARALEALEGYLGIDPHDPWALREKASVLLQVADFAGALAAAEQALVIEPSAPFAHAVIGQVHLRRREFPEARQRFRDALQLSVDEEWILLLLLEACPEFSDRVEAVAWLQSALETLPSAGRSILRFREVANGVLKPQELKEALDRLRDAQPDHWESWSAGIQHRLSMESDEDALGLAVEASTRFPLIPGAWADLADVHRLRNEDREETAALEKARELSPGWNRTARRLAILHQRNLRPELGEAVLRSALSYDPLDVALLCDLAEACWARQSRDEACDLVERAIRLAPGYDRPWELLGHWSRSGSEPGRVKALAEELSEARPKDSGLRLRLIRILVDNGLTDQALQHAQSAACNDPAHVDTHDMLAFILAQLGRYDEAREACSPVGLMQSKPRELSGRAAWVEWQRGNRPLAVDLMKAAALDHPDYYWAWQTLADWHEELGNVTEATEAAERMAALNPGSPYPLGYLASLKIRSGATPAAITHLQRAVRIDPGYAYGTFTLLQLLCDSNRLAEAESVLALIRQKSSAEQTGHAEVIMACARRDESVAAVALAKLAAVSEQNTHHLASAADAMQKAGWTKAVTACLEPLLSAEGTNPEAGGIWMRARLASRKNPRLGVLRKATPSVRTRAFVAYIDSLGEGTARARLFWLLLRHRDKLKGPTETWGAVGYAMANAGSGFRRALIRWMQDWKSRQGVQPWMLFNFVHCMFLLGRDRHAMDVVKDALLMPADHTRPAFVAWAAVLSAVNGSFEEANAHLDNFPGEGRFAFVKACGDIARIVVEHHRQVGEDPTSALREARRKMRALREEQADAFAFSYVRRFYHEALHAMARTSGSPWRWWYRFRAAAQPLADRYFPSQAIVWIAIVLVLLAGIAAGGGGALMGGIILGLVIRAFSSSKRR